MLPAAVVWRLCVIHAFSFHLHSMLFFPPTTAQLFFFKSTSEVYKNATFWFRELHLCLNTMPILGNISQPLVRGEAEGDEQSWPLTPVPRLNLYGCASRQGEQKQFAVVMHISMRGLRCCVGARCAEQQRSKTKAPQGSWQKCSIHGKSELCTEDKQFPSLVQERTTRNCNLISHQRTWLKAVTV